jgi:hypothetical protein
MTRRVLPDTVAQAGVDLTLEARNLHHALRRAIATRRGCCSWDIDHASWVVTLHSPEEQDINGKTLEDALAWCLVWLMAKGTPGDWGLGTPGDWGLGTGHPRGLDSGRELGIGPFLV